MFPKPKSVLLPNTYAFESEPMVKPTGFREYDARWLFQKEINLMGIQALGMGLGALIAELGVKQEIVTGHDFRGYSASIKYALISGLMAAGCKVHDIGLAVTPMAYFAQFDLDVPCCAMVTASHNDNGWTGVKMGANRPLTFGPDEMTRLKEIVLNADFKNKVGGSYQFHENYPARYIADLTSRPKRDAQAQGRRGLRQRHRGRIRAAGAGGDRLRGDPARHRARPHVPEIQSES
ncbi:phosphomannomutase [Bradyrhizobium japonicum]